MKNICVITGSRAEFGLLKPLLNKFKIQSDIHLSLVVTGSHLSKSFGNTWTEIVSSGFEIDEKIYLNIEDDSRLAMINATAMAIEKFSVYFSAHYFDLVVVLGDRYEIFGASVAAAMSEIPIAHIHGGETTEGAVDEFLRHSITKMSSLHFTACAKYRKRVIQLGEDPSTVFNVGALGVENIISLSEIPLMTISNMYDMELEKEKYAVVVFHPVTKGSEASDVQVQALITALEMHPELKYIVIKANADAGGREINRIWDESVKRHTDWRLVSSMSPEMYLSTIKHSAGLIGNSSSGIIEAPSLHVPTVNIGDRQKGREMSESIVNCQPCVIDIDTSIKQMLNTEFRKKVTEIDGLFGDGNTSTRIVDIISDFLNNEKIPSKKMFHDVIFEV